MGRDLANSENDVGYGSHHRSHRATERERGRVRRTKLNFFSLSPCLCGCGGDLRNARRVVSFCRMKTAIFLTLTVCCLLTPVFAQPKTKNVAAPANANPYQEADNLFTFGDDAARDKQSMGVIERALDANGNDYQWLWRAARVYYFVDDSASRSGQGGDFEKGINGGQRAEH